MNFSSEEQYCLYYHALINKADCWFVTAILKEAGNISIDRTIDVSECLNEFFVPESQEQQFLQLMNYFISIGLVANLKKLPNRLADSSQKL